jgi:hypothetical protein
LRRAWVGVTRFCREYILFVSLLFHEIDDSLEVWEKLGFGKVME